MTHQMSGDWVKIEKCFDWVDNKSDIRGKMLSIVGKNK